MPPASSGCSAATPWRRWRCRCRGRGCWCWSGTAPTTHACSAWRPRPGCCPTSPAPGGRRGSATGCAGTSWCGRRSPADSCCWQGSRSRSPSARSRPRWRWPPSPSRSRRLPIQRSPPPCPSTPAPTPTARPTPWSRSRSRRSWSDRRSAGFSSPLRPSWHRSRWRPPQPRSACWQGVRLAPATRRTAGGGAWAELRRSLPVRRAMLLMSLLNLVLAALGVTLVLLARGSWTGWWTDDTAYGVASGALGFGALAAPSLARLRPRAGRSGAGGRAAAGRGGRRRGRGPDRALGAAAAGRRRRGRGPREAAATAIVQREARDDVRASLFGVADSCMVGRRDARRAGGSRPGRTGSGRPRSSRRSRRSRPASIARRTAWAGGRGSAAAQHHGRTDLVVGLHRGRRAPPRSPARRCARPEPGWSRPRGGPGAPATSAHRPAPGAGRRARRRRRRGRPGARGRAPHAASPRSRRSGRTAR